MYCLKVDLCKAPVPQLQAKDPIAACMLAVIFEVVGDRVRSAGYCFGVIVEIKLGEDEYSIQLCCVP